MGKYTCKKNGMSKYPERLQARGVSPSQVRMPFIDGYGRKYNTYDDMKRGENRIPSAQTQ